MTIVGHLDEFNLETEDTAMAGIGGRAFQREAIATTKMLGQEHVGMCK